MCRFKSIFDLEERERIYNTFILSNFIYCSIIWHLCGKVSSKKIENVQESALKFMLKDEISTYKQLLEKCNYATLHIRRSLNCLNP